MPIKHQRSPSGKWSMAYFSKPVTFLGASNLRSNLSIIEPICKQALHYCCFKTRESAKKVRFYSNSHQINQPKIAHRSKEACLRCLIETPHLEQQGSHFSEKFLISCPCTAALNWHTSLCYKFLIGNLETIS